MYFEVHELAGVGSVLAARTTSNTHVYVLDRGLESLDSGRTRGCTAMMTLRTCSSTTQYVDAKKCGGIRGSSSNWSALWDTYIQQEIGKRAREGVATTHSPHLLNSGIGSFPRANLEARQ